ncbi:MAG: hypothetical protein QM500_14460 [Methylococcales bacterium]
MNVFIDLETIPNQSPTALQDIMDIIEVKAPALTKPKLIEALTKAKVSADKFMSVDELKAAYEILLK